MQIAILHSQLVVDLTTKVSAFQGIYTTLLIAHRCLSDIHNGNPDAQTALSQPTLQSKEVRKRPFPKFPTLSNDLAEARDGAPLVVWAAKVEVVGLSAFLSTFTALLLLLTLAHSCSPLLLLTASHHKVLHCVYLAFRSL